MTFDINSNNCIKFTDTSTIPFALWTKFLNVINHLGYGIPDENSLKEYFDMQCYLQPDQSLAVLQILGLEHKNTQYSQQQINTDNQKAKDFFGITNSFDIAGYLLIDGTLLNFSYDNYMRDKDHRDIKDAIDVENEGYSAGLIQFVNYGNIRLLQTGFELSRRPTNIQKQLLSQFIKQTPELYVDIANTDGHVVKTFDYQFATPSKVLNDITNYFDSIET